MNASEELAYLRERGWERLYPNETTRITVGLGTCGISAGAQLIYEYLVRRVEELGLQAEVVGVGCAGMCYAEPLVQVQIPGWPRAVYANVDEQICDAIMDALVESRYAKANRMGFVYRDWLEGFGSWVDLVDIDEDEDEESACPDDLARLPFLRSQEKRLSASWGRITPWSIEEYVAEGGYAALLKALFEMNPDEVIEEIEQSGLRGRGGAGFPTGNKWRAVASEDDTTRYVIANADEGDPGAYMDRGLMESDPHRLIEGMVIAARAVGAQYGFIFTRAEYPGAIRAVERALEEARDHGVIGTNILGSGWDFDIELVQSAGAYICGEEGAMLEVLEGRRPDPRSKPPFPAHAGFEGHPTSINNVETLANVPSIVLHGARRFRSCGTEESPGTKIFSLAGTIEHAGLIEVPLGISLATVVEDIACIAKENLHNVVFPQDSELAQETGTVQGIAVQVGGPSGAILPVALDKLTLDYEGLVDAGGIMGSGGIVVLGRRACVVDTIRYFLEFSARASCGRCFACRELLAQAAEIVGTICADQGNEEDLERLDDLAKRIPRGSKCGLGKMAANPLASGLRYFRENFEAHLAGSCPNLVCKDLMHFEVIADACPGCLCCLPSCPTGAIKGVFNKPFVIDQDKCTKCWMCVSQCPYPALMAFPVPAGLEGDPKSPLPEAPHSQNDSEKFDTDACVYCNRCIDACREHGAGVLYFDGCGRNRTLKQAMLDSESSCTHCDACRAVCPTGAIESLFRERST